MRSPLLGTAAVLAALAAPGPAAAAIYTVDPNTASNGCVSTGNGTLTCKTLGQAASSSNGNSETDAIRIRPGTYAESVAFADSGISVTAEGDSPAPVIVGNSTTDPVLSFTGGGTKLLQRLQVRANTTASAGIEVAWSSPLAGSTMYIDSSVLSGDGSDPALSVERMIGAEDLTVRLRHGTIADAGAAPATASLDPDTGGETRIELANSLVQGSRSADTTVVAPTNANPPNGWFVAPASEDFHLRADAGGAINAGGGAEGSPAEATRDVDGTLRPGASDWDLGADEFVNQPPTMPTIDVSDSSPLVGQEVTFTAVGSGDPDPGGSITRYSWAFGDGATATGASVKHAYTSAGSRTVTVQAIDNNGGTSDAARTISVRPPSPEDRATTTSGGGPQLLASGGIDIATLTAAALALDRDVPSVAAAFPRPRQAVAVGRGVLGLRGTVADDGGVRRVELALSRRSGSRCQWFDGRRAFRAGRCTAPRFFRAVVDDFTWRYAFPRGVRPLPGAYELRVRAVDLAGNANASFAAASRTLVPFRFVRASVPRG